ncbi:MAG: GNAT family N-acetyltransferase [Nanoarchaeota archaeon]|nr:GNAT family N-acetyltransferase [Nanoarchaeota archaeon]
MRAFDSEKDGWSLKNIYRSAFAEEPWGEFKKCCKCGKRYGKDDVEEIVSYGRFGEKSTAYTTKSRRCENNECMTDMRPIDPECIDTPLYTSKNLVDFWSNEDIDGDLEFALSQSNTIVLVAESGGELLGFTWGYKMPEKPFLQGKVNKDSFYIDEVAVRGDKRRVGVGTALCKELLKRIEAMEISDVVLRTDERNTASMGLYEKFGFKPIIDEKDPRGFIYDPSMGLENRIYLRKELDERE